MIKLKDSVISLAGVVTEQIALFFHLADRAFERWGRCLAT